jgi:molybdopterin synthase catalytic subunit
MEIVTEAPLDPGRLFGQLRKSGSGSILFHYAVVKSRAGDKVSAGIRFERNGDMEAELAGISADIKGRWPVDDVLLVRRIGTLDIGDVISLVAVSSPASHDAFEACRFGLERLKKMVCLRKTEMLRDRGKSLPQTP